MESYNLYHKLTGDTNYKGRFLDQLTLFYRRGLLYSPKGLHINCTFLASMKDQQKEKDTFNGDSQVTVALIQMDCEPSTDQNLQKATDSIKKSADLGGNIICLPELFLTPYFCQTEDTRRFELSEPIPGPTTETLCKLCEQLGVVLIVPLFERRAPGIYHNSAVVIDADGTLLGKYRKMHIPDDPCFYEKFYFTPGDLGFKTFRTRFGLVGVLICWDQWFPEAARLTSLSGAQFLFYPTAIGFQEIDRDEVPRQKNAWQTIQKSHAISNGVFVGAVNRVGREDNLTFWGQSFICDPLGEVLAHGSDQPDIIIAQCDLSLISETRQNWPFLRDRRVDAYANLNRIFLDGNE